MYCNTPSVSRLGGWMGTSACDVGEKVDASGPEGFDFGGYDAFFVGFAGGLGEGWFKVSVAVFPGLREVSRKFYFRRHCGMVRLRRGDRGRGRGVSKGDRRRQEISVIEKLGGKTRRHEMQFYT